LVVEALLGDLADDDVGVVAVGRNDHRVGLLDSGLAQDLDVHPMAEHEAAVPVVAEPAERLFLLVDGRDVPALVHQLEGNAGADSAASNHQSIHALTLAQLSSLPSSSITPSGKATTSTSAGALRSTSSTVGEKKRDCLPQPG